RTRKPASPVTLGTHDLSASLRGGLQFYQAAPVGLNLNYSARRTTVESPTDADTVQRLLTSDARTDATVRFRVNNNRYLNLLGNVGTNTTLTGTVDDYGYKGQGRWDQGPWRLEADGGQAVRDESRPRRNNGGGYDQTTDNRSASGSLERQLNRKLSGKLSGEINLNRTRSSATADSASPPTPRDIYLQSYRLHFPHVPTHP